MLLIYILATLATAFAGWRAWRRLRFFLHVAQLEGYRPSRLGRWLGENRPLIAARSHLLGAMLLILGTLGVSYVSPVWIVAGLLLAWSITFASSRPYRNVREKKPLAFTNRLKRLLGAAAILVFLPVVAGTWIGLSMGAPGGFLPYLLGFLVADLGAPFYVLLALACVTPVESYFQEGFKRQARQKVANRPDLTVIGITGSYGKTSTKFIVAEILRQRYNVLATPGSYNTPMGLCLVINNKLRPEHQMLVLEMGMRYEGDIQELCDIARPELAIVTSVGPAHLETMGSVEAIAEEKASIIDCARPEAPVILNVDNEYVAAMAGRATGPIWRVSTEGHPEADITAREIHYGPEGARFVVRDDTGSEHAFQTKLLGRHNVLNILLGVALGRQMGMRLRQIAHAVARLEPVDHRLQLRREGSITIIDDAFNSNPVGARNAVEILGQFDTGRRIIVTPGMIELGPRQATENRRLGTHIARHADLAVLVGNSQTRPIQEGLRGEDFPEEKIKVFDGLFEAQDFLKTYLREGDVVLYENDLPDHL